MRRFCLVLAILAAITPIGALAPLQANADPLLDAVPNDAWAMVGIRNLGELDHKLLNLNQSINSPMSGMSGLATVKGLLGLIAGVNDDAGAAVVVLPAETLDDLGQRLAILIPATDPQALLSLLEPEELGNGVTKIMFRGVESYATPKSGFVVIGPSADLVTRVAGQKNGITDRLTPHQRQRWADDDLTVWVNVGAVAASAAVAESLSGTGLPGMDEDSLKSLKSVQASLRVGPEGLRLGFYLDARSDSRLGQVMASAKPATKPLLGGLPGEPFILSAGMVISADSARYMSDSLGQTVTAMLPMLPELPPEKATELTTALTSLVTRARGVGMALNVLPEGPAGIVSATKLVRVDGEARAYLDSIRSFFASVKSALPKPEPGPDGNTPGEFFEYRNGPDQQTADELVIHPERLGALTEDEFASLKKVIGKEGLLVRLAAVDDHQVLLTFGGGAERFASIRDLVRSGKAPLAEAGEIQAMASMAPSGRLLEGYLSLTGLGRFLTSVAQAVDTPVPVSIPPVAAPIAMFTSVTSEKGQQTDVVIPADVLKAAMQVAQAQMLGGPPPSSAGEPTGE